MNKYIIRQLFVLSLMWLPTKIITMDQYHKFIEYDDTFIETNFHYKNLREYPEIINSIDESEFKKEFFPLLENIAIKELFTLLAQKSLSQKIIDETSENIMNLYWCECPNVETIDRFILIFKQLNNIARQYPNKNTPIVHVEFGEEGCLQSYPLATGLLALDYNSIEFHILGNHRALSERVKLLNTLLEDTQRFHAHCYSNNFDSYMSDIEQNVLLAPHSFAMVDAIDSKPIFLDESCVIADKTNTLQINTKYNQELFTVVVLPNQETNITMLSIDKCNIFLSWAKNAPPQKDSYDKILQEKHRLTILSKMGDKIKKIFVESDFHHFQQI